MHLNMVFDTRLSLSKMYIHLFSIVFFYWTEYTPLNLFNCCKILNVLLIMNIWKIVLLFIDFDSFGKPTHFDYMNKLLDKISVVYFIEHLIGICIISTSKAFYISRCKEENDIRGINEVCGMVGRIWLPFNYDWFPLKQIIFIYEVFIFFQ